MTPYTREVALLWWASLTPTQQYDYWETYKVEHIGVPGIYPSKSYTEMDGMEIEVLYLYFHPNA